MSSYQLTRSATSDSALMADYVRSAAYLLQSSLGSYVQYFAKPARPLSRELYLDVTRTLQQFDDHILATSVRHGEIEHVVRNGRGQQGARKTVANRTRRTPRHATLKRIIESIGVTLGIVTNCNLRTNMSENAPFIWLKELSKRIGLT